MGLSLKLILLISACLVTQCYGSYGWGGNDKVKLKDIEVLTLYADRMTTGKRSSPVPQLQCTGGTAGCNTFIPKVVQCYNRGSDGYDVQWECKSDMDNAYRFGSVEVVCEGYDYADDPYVLQGSCGLEYTIDLTKEGYGNQGHNSHHNYYGSDSQRPSSSYGWKESVKSKSSGTIGNLIVLAGIGVVIYAMYRTCIAPSRNYSEYGTSGGDDPSDGSYRRGGGYGWGSGPGSSPPPPGFNPNMYPGGCDGSVPRHTQGFGGGGGGGGFWSGMATGGLLGYMFGNTGNRNGPRQADPWTSGHSTGWSQPSSGFSAGSSNSSAGGSTGTRTASGFGGTRRR